MANKPNYGIDAPAVIRWLFFFGAISFAIAFGAYFFLRGTESFYAPLICGYFCLNALAFLIPAGWMVYGSLTGKQKILSDLIQDLHLKGNERILDLGCGRGMFLIEVAKHLPQGRAFGIDLWFEKDQSGNGPESALQNAEIEGVRDRVEVLTADMCELPFPDQTFDLVVSSLAIHNLPDSEDRTQALKETLRVLKPGGRFALLDLKNGPEYAAILRQNGGIAVKLSSPHYHYFPPVRIVKGKKE
ncbi:MAG: class I SAM-dependent methyltransferase [Chlamydiota bacterium]